MKQAKLVRQSTTDFEKFVAFFLGLITCGPIGAVAAYAALCGLQGKWGPWFLLGIPSAMVINIINIAVIVTFFDKKPEFEKYFFGGGQQAEVAASNKTEPRVINNATSERAPAQLERESSKIPLASEASPFNRREDCTEPTRNANERKLVVCDITKRVNANGHTVWDVTLGSGSKYTYVFWDDGSVEIFWPKDKANQKDKNRVEGNYSQDGDWVTVLAGDWKAEFRRN